MVSEEQCSTVSEQQCVTVSEPQCSTVQERQCDLVNEEQCRCPFHQCFVKSHQFFTEIIGSFLGQ